MNPGPRKSSGQQAAGSALLRTPAPETRPRVQVCESCEQQTLLARTTSGLDVVVDAAPLSPVGELQALLAGRATYTWHRIPDHLAHRYPLAIRSRPAGTPRQTVHPAHRCGDTWPALQPGAPPPGADHPGTDAPPY